MASPEPTVSKHNPLRGSTANAWKNKPSSPSGDHEPQSSKSANNPSIDKIDMTSEGDAVASASTAEHTPFVGASGGVQVIIPILIRKLCADFVPRLTRWL